MTVGQPEMRASHVQQNLKSLERFTAIQRERVLARLQPEILQMIEGAHRLGWLPLETDVALTEAVDSLGKGMARSWSRDALLASIEGPLVRPFVKGALNVFGTAVSVWLKLLPKGFPLIYRGAGELAVVDESERQLTLLYENVPSIALRSRPYLEGFAGAFESAFVLGNVKGAIAIEVDGAAQCVRFPCSWEPTPGTDTG